MGPLELVGKVHVHVHAGNGMLNALCLIKNGNRVADILDSDLVDLDFSMIFLVLDIVHLIFRNRWRWRFRTPMPSPF